LETGVNALGRVTTRKMNSYENWSKHSGHVNGCKHASFEGQAQRLLSDDARYTREVADEGWWGDLGHVPTEGHLLLQTHEGNASGGTDDKQGATGGGAIGDKVPQGIVGRVRRKIVHTLGGSNQRDVINHGRGESKQDGYQCVRWDEASELTREGLEQADALQATDSERTPKKNNASGTSTRSRAPFKE